MRDQALIDFVDLAVAYLDGRASDSQVTDLTAHLKTDPTKRDLFVDLSMTPELIREAHDAKSPREVVPIASPKPRSAAKRTPGITTSKPIPFIIYPISIAAAALLTAAIVVVYLIAFTTDPQPDPIKPDRPGTPGPAVATLIENTGTLTTPHGYPAEGEDFSAGEYTLSGGEGGGGTAEFMLTNAVNVKLRGETRMWMRNDMNVALTRGSANFVVPRGAKGFTVHLPDKSRIVDLGTAFRVDVNEEGHTHLRVTEGEVEWTAAGVDAAPVLVGAGQIARLIDGRVVASATAFVPIAIKNAGFENGLGLPVGGGLIATVNDWTEEVSGSVWIDDSGTRYTPEPDRMLYLAPTGAAVHQDLDHPWSSTDTFTLGLVATEPQWGLANNVARFRIQLRQADGTVLWDSGLQDAVDTAAGTENAMSYTGTGHEFSWTIQASGFAGAGVVEGSPINLRIAHEGGSHSAPYLDDVTLSVLTEVKPIPSPDTETPNPATQETAPKSPNVGDEISNE